MTVWATARASASRFEYSQETEALLGTGGALRLADRFFEPRALVLNGDTYLAADYAQILEGHLEARTGPTIVATITVSRLEEIERYGSVVLDSAEHHVTGFREKATEANRTGLVERRRLCDRA